MDANTVHVEIGRIADVLAGAPSDCASRDSANWLSESERARLAQMHSDSRRAQYLAGHWLVRALLARACGGTAAQWQLEERQSQPPLVRDHGDALRVSIAHSKDWIAAAVATIPVGIDLEQRPRILDASIESLLLNPDEPLGSLDPDAMLQRWVVKEAWIKCNGGSALPAWLSRIRLRAAAREHADVSIDSCDAFHFAMAVAPHCIVKRVCAERLVPGAGFKVAVAEE